MKYFVDQVPLWQAGERVVAGLPLKDLFGVFPFGDVQYHVKKTLRMPIASIHGPYA